MLAGGCAALRCTALHCTACMHAGVRAARRSACLNTHRPFPVPPLQVLEGLAGEALRKIRTFSPQALSNTLWGLSKLGIQAGSG